MPEDVKKLTESGAKKGIKLWIKLVDDEEVKPEHRIRAAENLVAYAYGRPAQAVDVTTDSITVRESLDERLQVISRALTAPAEVLMHLQAAKSCIYSDNQEPISADAYAVIDENIQESE